MDKPMLFLVCWIVATLAVYALIAPVGAFIFAPCGALVWKVIE